MRRRIVRDFSFLATHGLRLKRLDAIIETTGTIESCEVAASIRTRTSMAADFGAAEATLCDAQVDEVVISDSATISSTTTTTTTMSSTVD